jgi:hypothetical protein
MTDKNFIKSLKKDLILIHSNLGKLDENELEILLWGAIYGIDKQFYSGNVKNKPKSNANNEMIEERVYPADYLERVKYILAWLRYHYSNYKTTYQYIKTTKKERYLGIPPFEFWAIKNDMEFYALELKGNLKEFRDIFVEYYLNKLSLSKFGGKYYNDSGRAGKKRAENLNNRFCAALAKALELKDIADAHSKIVKIENKEFKLYKLMKEMDNNKPDKP